MLHQVKVNQMNLSKKVKVISTKRLKKDLIDKFSILNGAKYFAFEIFKNYLVFVPAIKHITHFHRTTQKSRENLMEYKKKVLKI